MHDSFSSLIPDIKLNEMETTMNEKIDLYDRIQVFHKKSGALLSAIILNTNSENENYSFRGCLNVINISSLLLF